MRDSLPSGLNSMSSGFEPQLLALHSSDTLPHDQEQLFRAELA